MTPCRLVLPYKATAKGGGFLFVSIVSHFPARVKKKFLKNKKR